MRASDVLPVPRGPTKRIACATRLVRTALRRVSTTASWPTTWANVCARQRRYSAWWAWGWIGVGWSVTSIGRLRECACAQANALCRAPPVVDRRPGPTAEGGSDQAVPRHPTSFAECCFLPDLTRFAIRRCAGPDPRHRLERRPPDGKASRRNSALLERIAGTGHR